MKLKKIFSTAFLFSGMFFAYSQNVASTANLTSGGLQAGTGGAQNTFYGYRSGAYNTTGIGNVCIGSDAGITNNGNNNVYVGIRAGTEESSPGSHNVFIGAFAGFTESEVSNRLIIGSGEDSKLIWGDFALDQLKLNGKVGIGNGFPNFPTTAGTVNVANYNLFVKGGILTEEVRVNLQSNWADYVFFADYKLKPLEEVEAFINQNGHLPNMPSGAQVKEEGVELGEMAKMQQEKIEELTLYILQLNKENQKEKEQNEALQKKLSDLEEKVNLLLSK